MSAYPESRDYDALADLVEKGVNVICLLRDYGAPRLAFGYHEEWYNAPGFPPVNTRAAFIEGCERVGLTYIPPAIPSTELPTEEGPYWWRKEDTGEWEAVTVYSDPEDGGRLWAFGRGFCNRHRSIHAWERYAGCIGQWVRIRKPGEA